ncbi:MAG: hypothetical protein K6A92_01300 [Lachnospiraceae bacterium]|nr:hypothetical protein [Lachnospiraceae bacterium]
MNETTNFEYRYNADRAKEAEAIRRKYVKPEEDKLEVLKALDRKAESKGKIAAMILGVLGALILGGGMSLIMEGAAAFLVLGIIIGVIGLIVLGFAYPVYKNLTTRERAKVADQVEALAKEIQ